MKRLVRVLTYMLCAVFFFIPVRAEEGAYGLPAYTHDPHYYAGAVSVLCARTGTVLYESNARHRHYAASLVKVMTALVVLENIENLQETVTLSEGAATLPWYAAHMGLVAGDEFTVLEGLYGIMLPSANEVANALAEHVAGSLPAFLEIMNARAAELGARDTYFVNACGLPGDGQYTTAHDMSLILREAVTHPIFVDIINTEFFDFPPVYNHPEGRTIRNTHRLVRYGDELFHPIIVGGKTGWIIAARNTLTSYAVCGERGLIITVLYTEERRHTFTDTLALMDYGFRRLEYLFPPEVERREITPADPEEIAAVLAEFEARQAAQALIAAVLAEYEARRAAEIAEPDNPEPAADPEGEAPTPWESLAAFARNLFIALGAAVAAGIAGTLIFWRYRQWTSSSRTSPP